MAENAFSNLSIAADNTRPTITNILSIVPGRSERRPRHAIQAEYRNEIMERPSVAAFWRGEVAAPVYEALEHVLQWMRQNLIAIEPRLFLATPSRPTAGLTSWNWWRVMAMLNSTMADQVNLLYDYLKPKRLQHGFIVPRFSNEGSHEWNRLRFSVNTYNTLGISNPRPSS